MWRSSNAINTVIDRDIDGVNMLSTVISVISISEVENTNVMLAKEETGCNIEGRADPLDDWCEGFKQVY